MAPVSFCDQLRQVANVGFERDFHIPAGRGSVHEMHDALLVFDAEAGVRDINARLGGADADDITGLEQMFGGGDFIQGKIFQVPLVYLFFGDAGWQEPVPDGP